VGPVALTRMTVDDVDAVLVMCHRFFNEWHDRRALGPLDEPMVRAVLETIVLDPDKGAGWLAHVDGVPAGMLLMGLTPNLITGERTAEELVWWVDPAHRSGRLGIRLLDAAVEWARKSGSQICKMVAPSGSTVGRYLSRRGFAEMETAFILRL
jgi:GNAT superfamily N-acetyltransferase